MDLKLADSYGYASLADGYFRTLLLHPGSGDDPLHCSLQTSLLNNISFESISYTWGNATKNHEIRCEGKIIPITANLWTALRHLRSATPRMLWADSICIDQRNNEERAQQVGVMGQIYRSAQRVLIFLGPDDFGHGANVCSLLGETATMIRKELQLCGNARDTFPYPDNNASILQDKRWASLERMFEQRWFRRGWVVQEASLARQGRLIWGKYEINWDDLTLVAAWINFRTKELWWRPMHIHLLLYLSKNKDITQTMRSKDLKFGYLALLYGAKDLQFSDARDRIYAFAEVARDLESCVSVIPDYNAPFLHTYQAIALEYIRQNKDVKLLEFVRHTEDSFQQPVASWVPRWDIDMSTLVLSTATRATLLKTRNLTLPEPNIIDNSTLRVRSVIVDDVIYASEINYMLDGDSLGLVKDLWRDVFIKSTTSVYAKAHLIDAFMTTMMSCCFFGELSKWRSNEAAYTLQLLQIANFLEEDELEQRISAARDGDLNEVVKYMRQTSHEKTFILTRRGYMGLAPRVTQEGDICAIIFGCPTPCILRKTDQTSKYRFAGGTVIVSKTSREEEGGKSCFRVMGTEGHRDWVDWDAEEQDIDLI